MAVGNGTIFEQATRSIVSERMENHEWATAIVHYIHKLNKGFWDGNYVDFIFQLPNQYPVISLETAFMFANIHTAIHEGKILVCDLPIGQTPSPDVDTEGNLRKLRKGLAQVRCVKGTNPIFDVDVWGGTQDEDGWLSWSPRLQFERFKDGRSFGTVWVKGNPRTGVPLEIGTQSAEKTYYQAYAQGSLARWPYGSRTIRIFYKNPEEHEEE